MHFLTVDAYFKGDSRKSAISVNLLQSYTTKCQNRGKPSANVCLLLSIPLFPLQHKSASLKRRQATKQKGSRVMLKNVTLKKTHMLGKDGKT